MKKIPADEYHKAEGISKTGLDWIAKSPAHYKAWLATPPEPTPQLIFGAAYHCMILEPEEYTRKYAIVPEIDRRTKDGKRVWEEFQERAKGKIVIPKEMQEQINDMAKVLWSKKIPMSLLDGGETEDSLFSMLNGVKVKVRPDVKRPDLRSLIDLKTCVDASLPAFSKAIANYRYHVQGAFYLDVANLADNGNRYDRFVFIAQEKTPPYEVGIYLADNEMLEIGRSHYDMDLETYRKCLETDTWPGYPEAVLTISLPKWATY